MSWSYAKETRDRDGSGPYWTDGRFAENFLAGMLVGAESKDTFRDYETIFGDAEGFVYFIGIGSEYVTHVKIGFTRGNPYARMRDLQTGCPFQMRMLGFVLGNMAQEAELHDVFKEHRCVGEWFEFAYFVENNIRHQLEAKVLA